MDSLDLMREAVARTRDDSRPQDVILTLMSEEGCITYTLADCLKILAAERL